MLFYEVISDIRKFCSAYSQIYVTTKRLNVASSPDMTDRDVGRLECSVTRVKLYKSLIIDLHALSLDNYSLGPNDGP